MSLQLMVVPGGQDVEGAESGVSGSCDIMTATSDLSDDVSSELTAEGRREMWRRAHHHRDVCQHDADPSGRYKVVLTLPLSACR